jgi:hypothetical protein
MISSSQVPLHTVAIVTFVARLEEAKLLCSIISDTSTGVIIPPRALLQII